ncbi:hypothetical protein HNP55_002495 [Paucibacter oligotrophus]|uniref:DUF1653 domain-containing protein n=2 Tax=Roseateles oligotrophus TaxID=1769250 RepID=A0A840LBE6_9BURK|nr:hypothetical protein [Roseateles oligotrophus]
MHAPIIPAPAALPEFECGKARTKTIMSEELSPLPAAPTGRYRHYKGGEYEVIGVARHSETLEPLVLYRPLYNATGLWVRPYEMFFGELEVEGRIVRRFSPID